MLSRHAFVLLLLLLLLLRALGPGELSRHAFVPSNPDDDNDDDNAGEK